MEPTTAYDPRDLTVHLKDAALYILVRWRLLVSAALAGAILLTAVRYVGDVRRYRLEQTTPEPITSLSADSRARVAAAMGYHAAYRRVCAYNESAPMMQIDPGAVPTRWMRLLVTGDGCWTAACLYRDYVESEHLYREMAQEGTSTAYVAELVTVEVESEPAQRAPRQVFLSVQVLAPSEEMCNRLSSVVHRTVEEVYTTITEAVGEHSVVWALDRYTVLRDEMVATHQQTSLEQQSRLQEEYAAARQALDGAEEEYLLRLQGADSTAETKQPPSISRMAWLWGFLLGGGIGFAWLSLRYLFGGRVLSSADVLSRHGIAVTGVLGGENRSFARLRDAADDATLVWQRLAMAAQVQGVKRLYLSVPEAQRGRLDGLSQALSAYGITLSVGGAPCADGESAESLASCDGFATASVCGHTPHRVVAEELALARQWRIPIVGVLLLQ